MWATSLPSPTSDSPTIMRSIFAIFFSLLNRVHVMTTPARHRRRSKI